MQTSVFDSIDVDSADAVAEIIGKMKQDGRVPAALYMVAGIDHEHQVIIDAFYKEFPNIVLSGGTTDGEIADGEFHQDSLTVCCFWQSPDIQFTVVGIEKVDNSNIEPQVVSSLGNAVASLKQPLKIVIQTSGGMNVNSQGVMMVADPIVRKAGAILAGGTSGDQFRFKNTVEFINNKAVRDGATFLIISGNVKVHHESTQGWKPVGEFHTVTKSTANIVEQIDDMPVVEFYNRLFKIDKNIDNMGFMQAINPFPLAIYDSEDSYSLRTPLVRTPDNKIAYAGGVPEGAKLKYTRVNKEELLSNVTDCANRVRSNAGFEPNVYMVFSCTTRCHLLGTDVVREVSNFKKAVGKGNVIGFYAYGELAPYAGGKDCHFHNNTLTTIALG
jgi:hypothetical protein